MQHDQTPGTGSGGYAQQGPLQHPDQLPVTWGQFRFYMQGLQHARDGLVLGLIGIFFFGIVFGPLALSQARKAEAFGVNAQNAKVVGWIAIGWFCVQFLFLIAYVVFFLIILRQVLEQRGLA
jgi:hypothetical protein